MLLQPLTASCALEGKLLLSCGYYTHWLHIVFRCGRSPIFAYIARMTLSMGFCCVMYGMTNTLLHHGPLARLFLHGSANQVLRSLLYSWIFSDVSRLRGNNRGRTAWWTVCLMLVTRLCRAVTLSSRAFQHCLVSPSVDECDIMSCERSSMQVYAPILPFCVLGVRSSRVG